MRNALAILLAGMFAAFALPAVAEDDCFGNAQDQYSLNECARKSADAADDKLNAVYRELIKAQSKDQVAIAAIKNAQRAWIAFRDLEIESNFPAANKPLEYGSMYPQCYASSLEALTRIRTAELCLRLDEKAPVCKGVEKNPKLTGLGC